MKKRDIVLINIPFTDLSEKKLRPALVIGVNMEDILCCFISSTTKGNRKTDILIKKDTKNKLKVDSLIKPGKIFTLHSSLIERSLGILNQETYNSVVQKIVNIIK